MKRRGIGVLLVLVVTLALVLFIAGVAQLMSSGQVYRQTARGSGGLTAEYLARSAVAELFFHVQKAVSDPAHPVFRRLREALLTGEQSAARDGLIDISKSFDCSALRERLERSPHRQFYRSFHVEALSVRAGIDRTRAVYTNLALKLSATASLSLGGNTVVRRVEETRQLGILLAAPKRPLDQVAFLSLDNRFVSDFRRACLATVQMAQLYAQIAAWLAQWQNTLAQKAPGSELSFDMPLPGGAPGQPPRVVRVMLTGEDYAFDGLWPPIAGDPTTIKTPPENAYLVATGTSPVDLAAYDHEAHLSEELEHGLARVPDVAGRVDRMMETFAAASGRPFGAAEHAAWAREVGAIGAEVHVLLELLIRELARVSAEMAPHVRPLPALSAFSLDAQGRLGPPLYPIAYHVNTQEQFDQLLDRHRRLNAHIAYQGEAPLKINRMGVGGRMVISSERAPIEVASLVSATKDSDAIVLAAADIAFTGGTIDAGILVRGRARFAGAPSIRGNLVLEYLPRKRERGQDQDLKGHVIYDPKLAAGVLHAPRDPKAARLTSYAIGFSTVPEDVEISWTP